MRTKTHDTELARLVRVELAKLDKTQSQLATVMQVDPAALSVWLRGGSDRRVPPSDLIERVAAGLDTLTHEQKGNPQ